MKHFDVDNTAGWLASLRYSLDQPDAWYFAATPDTDGRTCSWCSCGDKHHPDAVGHPFCGAPAVRIGRICHRGSGGPRFSICAEHLEALTADE